MITIPGIDSQMIANNLTPSIVSPPGDLLINELDERGISIDQFSKFTGIKAETITAIVQGDEPITPAFALIFEAALGISADLWMSLQADFDMQNAKRNPSFMDRLKTIRKIAAVL